MNFYKHHLGDYAAATSHLTWDEDCAYRRLLDQYYKREEAIPTDLADACRLIRATSPTQRRAVGSVLKEFFTAEPDGWHQKRGDAEIAAANAQADTNRRIAEERETKRRARMVAAHEALNASSAVTPHDSSGASAHASSGVTPDESFTSTYVGREPIQTPDTRHQTPDARQEKEKEKVALPPAAAPVSKTPRFDASKTALPPWLPAELWQRWCKDRKARGKAISEEGARGQLRRLDQYRTDGTDPVNVLEHAIASGNQGLYPPPQKVNGHSHAKGAGTQLSFREQATRASAERVREMTGGQLDDTRSRAEVIDMEEEQHALDGNR